MPIRFVRANYRAPLAYLRKRIVRCLIATAICYDETTRLLPGATEEEGNSARSVGTEERRKETTCLDVRKNDDDRR